MAATTLIRQDSTDKWQETDHRDQQKIPTGNRVRSKPAKDAVISGILSSLETLEAPRPGVQPNTFQIEDSRRHSLKRPFSSESFAGAPSIPFAQAVQPIAATESDDGFEDGFAAAPVIPTTRTAAGPHSGVRSSSSAGHGMPDPPSSNLVQELNNSTQAEVSNKLSAEDWVKSAGSPASRRLRRVSSHDTLRQAEPDKDFQVDQDFILNGLGSLAATPMTTQGLSPKMLGQARLYLEENILDMKLDDGDGVSVKSGHSRASSAGPSTPAMRPSRASKPSQITDSIPRRTSSLRQASSSPVSTRRRPRPYKAVRTPSLQRTISEDTSDMHWADLGEQDETVKRIMELRKKRETRLIMDEDYPSIPDTIDTRTVVRGTSSYRRTSSPERQLQRQSTSASETPSAKAIKILGIDNSGSAPHLNLSNGTGSSDGANDTAARAPSTANTKSILGSSQRTPAAAPVARRPLTSKSTTSVDPVISLDYSYAQAVDALQGADQEIRRRDLSSEQPRGMTTVVLRPDVHRRTTSNSSNNSPARLKKQRGRWNQPDVTEELGKHRRKSMNDARDEEPERRDSVEETVLEYLRTQRLSQKIADPQTGRKISFSEVGDPKGAAVMVCVGMGLTRYVTAFFDELATTLRLRLITIERPGVGESAPYSDRSGPLMWPSDVTAVCEHLGITKFSMLAHSAGAVYALATALILPHMVRGSIHLLAPWIPPSQLEAAPYDTENNLPAGALPRGQRLLRVLPAPFLRAANSSWINMGSLQPAKRKSSSPNGGFSRGRRTSSESPNGCVPKRPTTSHGPRPDNPRRESMMLMDQLMPETNPMENFPLTNGESGERRNSSLFLSATATPSDPAFTYAATALNAAEHAARERQSDLSSRLTQRTWEYAIKDSNPATDLIICLERHREIGFRYTDVKRRIVITHGSEDKRVPVGNVKWLAEQINKAALHRGLGTKESLAYDPGSEPGCEVRILENEDHGLMASPVIMADILTEIAGYWSAEERGRTLS